MLFFREGGIEIDKRELTFDRGRLHSNRNIVAYINRRPAEEVSLVRLGSVFQKAS